MPRYNYTVANKEGKKLSGSVDAQNEKAARTELNNLGFSVLSLNEEKGQENQSTPETENSNKFVFEAIDKNNKTVTGTIASNDKEKAFRRLQLEYNLTVTAIWPLGASADEITAAKKSATNQLHEQLKIELESKAKKAATEEYANSKKQEIVKNKIDSLLQRLQQLLTNFDQVIEEDQKALINKKINKLLRIKNSTNLDYILKTAEDLLHFVEDQEKTLKEKGLQEKRIELKMQTKSMLRDLNKSEKPDSLSEDIINRIEEWQEKTTTQKKNGNFLNDMLTSIKAFFETPPEIQALEDQIKVYNKQLWEFYFLYFKEPTPEYRTKVKTAIKTLKENKKKTKNQLKEVKKAIKERKKNQTIEEQLLISFISELNALSGWLLTFYLVYYFLSLYLTAKDFGLSNIPPGLNVYNSQFFKYILAVIFLLHVATSLKVNFFRKSIIANIALPVVFILGSLIALFNF